MSKTMQIVNLMRAAGDAGNTVANRVAALNAAKALKRSMKISFEKVGVSADEVAKLEAELNVTEAAEALPEAVNIAPTEPTEVEVAQAPVPAAERSKAGRKPGRLREQVMAEIEQMSGVSRKDRIQILMDKFGITKYNAAYYVDRVLP